jgi:hypothetical protein
MEPLTGFVQSPPQRATSRFARQTATMTDPRPQGTRRISHRFPNSRSAEPLLTTGDWLQAGGNQIAWDFRFGGHSHHGSYPSAP